MTVTLAGRRQSGASPATTDRTIQTVRYILAYIGALPQNDKYRSRPSDVTLLYALLTIFSGQVRKMVPIWLLVEPDLVEGHR